MGPLSNSAAAASVRTKCGSSNHCEMWTVVSVHADIHAPLSKWRGNRRINTETERITLLLNKKCCFSLSVNDCFFVLTLFLTMFLCVYVQ